MSTIADIIITCSISEDLPALTRHLNAVEDLGVGRGPQFIDAWTEPNQKWIGGTWASQSPILVSAINGLDRALFAKALRDYPFREPHNVIVFIRNEHEDRHTEFNWQDFVEVQP